jgi:hypothetical protein
MSDPQPPPQPEITETEVQAFMEALSRYCWRHDFAQFCAITGFTGDYAKEKWCDLQALHSDLRAFDSATLAKILRDK